MSGLILSIKRALKPFYRLLLKPFVGLRNARDRRLHGRRSKEAMTRLNHLAPRSVMMLCLGNICRSPYAARALSIVAPDVRVDSAGFIGPGRPPPEIALSAFDPVWSGTRAIPDPWGKDRETFQQTFVRIERCVDEVARILRSSTKETHA